MEYIKRSMEDFFTLSEQYPAILIVPITFI